MSTTYLLAFITMLDRLWGCAFSYRSSYIREVVQQPEILLRRDSSSRNLLLDISIFCTCARHQQSSHARALVNAALEKCRLASSVWPFVLSFIASVHLSRIRVTTTTTMGLMASTHSLLLCALAYVASSSSSPPSSVVVAAESGFRSGLRQTVAALSQPAAAVLVSAALVPLSIVLICVVSHDRTRAHNPAGKQKQQQKVWLFVYICNIKSLCLCLVYSVVCVSVYDDKLLFNFSVCSLQTTMVAGRSVGRTV